MGMRINQNVLSQSTYANLTSANNRLESSITKLSSGLRINSAADDAAGLAISEKMRRQIKGLGRAKLNAQDGISMIQSAEGALNETTSAIQRMRELALQSANDTLTSNDRLEIQKEVEELKKQINNIAQSTEFNTKKLLNGNQSALLSTSTDSVRGYVTGLVAGSGDYDISFSTVTGGVAQMQTSQLLKNKDGELVKGNTQLKDITAFTTESGENLLSSPQTLTLTGNGKTTTIAVDGQMTLNDLAASLQNAMGSSTGLGITGSSAYVVPSSSADTNEGGYIKITSGYVGEKGDFNIAGSQDIIDALGFSIARESVNSMVKVSMSDAFGNSRAVSTSHKDRASSLLDGIDIEFDSQAARAEGFGGIVDGLKFTSDATLKFKALGSDLSSVITIEVTISVATNSVASYYSLDGLAKLINKKIEKSNTTYATAVVDLSASVVDGELRITYNPSVMDETNGTKFEVEATGNEALGFNTGTYNGFVTSEKDVSKAIQGMSKMAIKDADNGKTLKVKVGGQDNAQKEITAVTYAKITTITAVHGDLVELKSFIASANSLIATTGARVDVINGSLVFTSEQVGTDNQNKKSKLNLTITDNTSFSAYKTVYGFNSKSILTYGSGDSTVKLHVVDSQPQLQIGADMGDNMKFGIADMGTEALELDDIDLTSVRSSEKALEKINKALDKVSSERSRLGAYQNRLNYTISNLTNTTTNLTSSESRIRDVDVASEMMEFTRNQIVTQAATSMLAQANALPQSALSLLG